MNIKTLIEAMTDGERNQAYIHLELWKKSSELTDTEIQLIKDKQPIWAIKSLRERTGFSLAESKRIVDRYRETL